MRVRALVVVPILAVAVFSTPHAAAADAGVAALQVGLHACGLYDGPIDGIEGPATDKAIDRKSVV